MLTSISSQPKTYLVQERLRVETIPVNPVHWIRRIFSIQDEDLKAKCGLDGYFFIRFIRAMIIIFLPLMALLVTILLPGTRCSALTPALRWISRRKETDSYSLQSIIMAVERATLSRLVIGSRRSMSEALTL